MYILLADISNGEYYDDLEKYTIPVDYANSIEDIEKKENEWRSKGSIQIKYPYNITSRFFQDDDEDPTFTAIKEFSHFQISSSDTYDLYYKTKNLNHSFTINFYYEELGSGISEETNINSFKYKLKLKLDYYEYIGNMPEDKEWWSKKYINSVLNSIIYNKNKSNYTLIDYISSKLFKHRTKHLATLEFNTIDEIKHYISTISDKLIFNNNGHEIELKNGREDHWYNNSSCIDYINSYKKYFCAIYIKAIVDIEAVIE